MAKRRRLEKARQDKWPMRKHPILHGVMAAESISTRRDTLRAVSVARKATHSWVSAQQPRSAA